MPLMTKNIFLIHCSYFNEERDVLFHEANNYNKNFNTLSSNFKFVILLNCQEHYIIKLLAKHVRLCLNKIEAWFYVFTHFLFAHYTTLFVHYITLIFILYKKWNESGFRPPLCTYRLNWARRTSWGWWDDWDDAVLQTQDSKFEPWRSEAEHATSRSRRLPTILTFTRRWGRNIFVSLKPPRPGTEPRTLAWKAAVPTTTLGPPPFILYVSSSYTFIFAFSICILYIC